MRDVRVGCAGPSQLSPAATAPATRSAPPGPNMTAGLGIVASANARSARSPTSRTVTATIPYQLFTHCGVHEALVGKAYYIASPVLADASGNPPPGWPNPYDSGTMTTFSDGTADFSDNDGHRAHFVIRKQATSFLGMCA